MHLKTTLRTCLLLATWLFLQNFNLPASHSRPEAATSRAAVSGGKSMKTPFIRHRLPSADHRQPSTGSRPPSTAYRIKKVVLDAGHGGKDPGCKGATSKEKDNALAIVLKLGDMISGAFPEVEVIYTRKTDEFIELKERAAIANRNKADLFISVHCNAVSASHIHGAETYVMGLHTADHNLEVAKRENAAIYYEENYQKNYEGYDPNSPEAHILGSVWQSAYLEQSILFASLVQQFAKSTATRADKGVKQAGFLVLRETSMPAVLVETGFLTNRTEEAFIASEDGQAQMAQAIFEAFESYKQQMEGAVAEQQKSVAAAGNKSAGTAQKNTGGPMAISNPPKSGAQASGNTAKPAGTPQNTAIETPKNTSKNTRPQVSPPPVATAEPVGPFRIFLMSWPMKIDKSTGQLALLSDVTEEKIDGKYCYFSGKYATFAEAEKMLPEIRNLGFRTASIVSVR